MKDINKISSNFFSDIRKIESEYPQNGVREACL